MIDWIKRQPVLASRLLDALLIAVGVALHKYGVDVPSEFKTVLDLALLAIAGGGTVAARSNVVPAVKLPEAVVERAAEMTPTDIARVEKSKS